MRKLKIIYTGGTIGGKRSPQGNIIEEDIKRATFINLLERKYPSLKYVLKQEKVQLSSVTPIKKFSENIIPPDWSTIAKSVYDACSEGTEAVVIAHGTDTMTYTAAALSFMLQGVKIPVILTGSNYPMEMEKTDAIRNMCDAIKVAIDKRFKGVFLVFSGVENKPSDIHLGTRVRKEKFYENCFKTVNTDIIGAIRRRHFLDTTEVIKIINKKLFNEITELNTKNNFELKNNTIIDKISFFKIYPGFNPEMIDYVVDKKETKGIILEVYNSGTACVEGKYSILKSIEKANSKNNYIPVFITSQHEGKVLMDTYISSKEIKEAGAIPLKDMITESAIPKLMWALGQTDSQKEVINLMLRNISGEIEDDEKLD